MNVRRKQPEILAELEGCNHHSRIRTRKTPSSADPASGDDYCVKTHCVSCVGVGRSHFPRFDGDANTNFRR